MRLLKDQVSLRLIYLIRVTSEGAGRKSCKYIIRDITNNNSFICTVD